ncbi:MAG: helix-turn-helix domain-containing protein [Devosia sp.]
MTPTPETLDLVWSCKAIAKVLGVTERACFHMLAQGEIPARQVGHRWVASRKALEAFFAEVAA